MPPSEDAVSFTGGAGLTKRTNVDSALGKGIVSYLRHLDRSSVKTKRKSPH